MSLISICYRYIEDLKSIITSIYKNIDRNEDVILIESYYNQIMVIKKLNTIIPIDIIYEYFIIPYYKQISSKDDDFFFSESDNIIKNTNLEQYNISTNDLMFITQIKFIWKHLSHETQQNIWKHIIQICKCVNKIKGGNFSFN